jgi:predicted nucleic acid-binding protein
VGVSLLFDTSILIGLERARLRPDDLLEPGAISVVTLEELYLGVLRSDRTAAVRRRRTYEHAATAFEVFPVDVAVGRACAEIRAEGRERRVRYAPLDSLIGATARVHGLSLVTQDEGMVGMLGVDVRLV